MMNNGFEVCPVLVFTVCQASCVDNAILRIVILRLSFGVVSRQHDFHLTYSGLV